VIFRPFLVVFKANRQEQPRTFSRMNPIIPSVVYSFKSDHANISAVVLIFVTSRLLVTRPRVQPKVLLPTKRSVPVHKRATEISPTVRPCRRRQSHIGPALGQTQARRRNATPLPTNGCQHCMKKSNRLQRECRPQPRQPFRRRPPWRNKQKRAHT
jgi:hypothetical protein